MTMLDATFNSQTQNSWFASLRRRQNERSKQGTSQFPIGDPDETGHIVMPLSQMHPGDYGHVLELRAEPAVRQHLLEMGFTMGASVEFIRLAPLSDPLTVRIRGYQLSLRRREAEAILIRRCPPEFDEPAQGT